MKTPRPQNLSPNLHHDPELELFLRRHISADGQVIEPEDEPEEPGAAAGDTASCLAELPSANLNEAHKSVATVFRALAHPDRLRIIHLLEHDELSVAAINDQLELGQALLSKHLAILRRAGLVSYRAHSTARFYRLNDPALPFKARAVVRVSRAIEAFDLEVVAAALYQPGGIIAMLSDTIYGLFARAADPLAVNRIYEVKRRDPKKNVVVLIDNIADMYEPPTPAVALAATELWPGPVTLVAPTTAVPEHLSHLDGELGYRVPAEADLRALLKRTGPLVAPSANPEGAPPAADIAETRAYFGNQVDLYVDGGRVTANKPSRIIRFTADGASEVLR